MDVVVIIHERGQLVTSLDSSCQFVKGRIQIANFGVYTSPRALLLGVRRKYHHKKVLVRIRIGVRCYK